MMRIFILIEYTRIKEPVLYTKKKCADSTIFSTMSMEATVTSTYTDADCEDLTNYGY